MIEFIFLFLLGILFYYLLPHYLPRFIKARIMEFAANHSFSSSLKKLESMIDKKEEELEAQGEDKLAKENFTNLLKAKKEAEDIKRKYLRLSERVKHDTNKVFEVISDWNDYCRLFSDWVNDREAIGFGIEPDWNRLEEINLRIDEIIKRFNRYLAKDGF